MLGVPLIAVAAGTGAVGVALFSAGSATTSDPASNVLLNYGVLGIFAAGLMMLARTSIKRSQDREDRLEREVTRLNEVLKELQDQRVAAIETKYIPGLDAATEAIQESTALMRELRVDLRYGPPPTRRTTRKAAGRGS